MARLPTKFDLSQPVSMVSKRVIASADQSAAGRGLASLGASLSALGQDIEQEREKKRREGIALDGTAADGNSINALYDLERTFDEDANFDTFGNRFDAGVEKIKKQWSATIKDPQARQLWEAQFVERSAATRNRVLGLGEKRTRETQLVSAKTGLEGYRNVIASPDASPEDRDYAKRNADASITALEASGKLTPAEADEWRETVIKGGDFILGEREIQQKGIDAISGKLPANVRDRASAAMSFFTSQGWSKEQAAGIVGNLVGESNLNTGARNPGDGKDGSDSIGIGQWNGERARALKAYAGERGLNWQDFGVQLAFVNEELNGSERSAGNALRSAKNVDEATAAFVGYERPAGWSSSNPRGAHNYKGRLTAAMQASGETIKPEWLTNQSPEKQFQLEQMADAQQRQNDSASAAQRKAEQGARQDDYNLRIATADPSLMRQTILDDPLIDNGQKATLVNAFDTKWKDEIATGQAIQAYAAGSLKVDPYDPEGKKLVDNLDEALEKALPEDRLQGAREELTRQTGLVSDRYLSVIRQGMESTDVSAVVEAAQAASRLSQINPAALGRRDGGATVQTFADDFSHYVNNLNVTEAQAAQRLMEMRDPTKKLARKALEPAAKEFIKQIEGESAAGIFDTVFGGEPDLGFSPGQSLGIQAEYLAIAEDQFFAANGDPEIAKNRAAKEMQRLYGVTEVTGRKVVMKHPPEKYWPMPESGMAYARIQLRQDIGETFPDIGYEGVDMESVQLVTTPETDAMVKRGEMPGYAVLFKDANGVLQTIPGKLWRPDATKIMEFEAEQAAAEQAEREAGARAEQGQQLQKVPYREIDPLAGDDPVFGARDDTVPAPAPLSAPVVPVEPAQVDPISPLNMVP